MHREELVFGENWSYDFTGVFSQAFVCVKNFLLPCYLIYRKVSNNKLREVVFWRIFVIFYSGLSQLHDP